MNPSDYPVGSIESRAAARALVQLKERSIRKLQIVSNIARPHRDGTPSVRVSEWFPDDRGGLVRVVNVPPDISEKDLEEILSQP